MDRYKEPFSFSNHSLDDTLIDLGVRFVINCPPEDISTPVRLFFQLEEAHWFYEDFAREQNPDLPTFKMKTFVAELYRAMPLMELVCPKPTAALNEFQHYKKNIPVRGGILVNEKLDKVLMVRSWKGSAWGFPRGKINKEEDDVVCAVREVLEETGYDMKSVVDPSEYIESTDSGKDVRLYVVSGVPEKTHFETQTRKEISRIAWIPVRRLPVFNKKITDSFEFYMVTPFMNGLKRYIGKKKGYATKLSKSETSALKNVLGITRDEKTVVHNDEATAQHLLSMLRTSAAQKAPLTTAVNDTDSVSSSDRSMDHRQDKEILLNLLKEGTPDTDKTGETTEHDGQRAEVESAKEILNLLQSEIATEKIVNTPPTIQPLANQIDTTTSPIRAPALPPNELLQSLVSSRRSKPIRRYTGISPNEHRSTPPSKNSLLNLLNKPKQAESAKLMALLKPVKPPQPAPRTRRSALMNLLQDSEGSDLSHFDRPIGQNTGTETPTAAAPPIKSGKTPENESGTENPHASSAAHAPARQPSSLLGLLRPQEPLGADHAAPSTTSALVPTEADRASGSSAEPLPENRSRVGSTLKHHQDADVLRQNSKRHALQTGNGASEPPKRQSTLLNLLNSPEVPASAGANPDQVPRADAAVADSSTEPPNPHKGQSACKMQSETPKLARESDLLNRSGAVAAAAQHPSTSGSADKEDRDDAKDKSSAKTSGAAPNATAERSQSRASGSSNPLLKLLDSTAQKHELEKPSTHRSDSSDLAEQRVPKKVSGAIKDSNSTGKLVPSKQPAQNEPVNSVPRHGSSENSHSPDQPDSMQLAKSKKEHPRAPGPAGASKPRNESQALMSLLNEKPRVQKHSGLPDRQGMSETPVTNDNLEKGSPSHSHGNQIHLLKLLNNT